MFEEAAIVEQVLATLKTELEHTGKTFELVCVDDGSKDATPDLLAAAQNADARVVPVPLSRNFGKESALAAGLAAARGRAVILMDADLQHPPELIRELVARWDEGYDVVSAKKRQRASEGLVYRVLAKLFNVLIGSAANASFAGASDFKLLDRQVVDTLLDLPERNRFFRGLVTWVGYRTVDVPFDVRARVGGNTKWSTIGLVRYSIKNLVAFSSFPLRAMAGVGFVTLVFAFGLALQTIYRWLRGDALSGFPTVILLELILGSLMLASLGVIALYLAAIYEEVKHRPVFIVRKPRSTTRAESDE
jgi:polyisoprenyl-phosphate glycosyltransferase